jgi:uncharacterized protein YndB with AHSA1/START domain
MKELVHDTIALEYLIKGSPEKVFKAITEEVGSWWTHSFREGSRVTMDARVGGAFEEAWEGGGALYASITYLDPAKKLRLSGPMGMSGAVACTMEYELRPEGEATRLALVHDILGRIEAGTVESYRTGWKELLGTSLTAWVEGRKGT